MSTLHCERVVGVNDDDRLPRPLDIACGRPAIAEVAPSHYGQSEWCACAEHADEAEIDGCTVERWS